MLTTTTWIEVEIDAILGCRKAKRGKLFRRIGDGIDPKFKITRVGGILFAADKVELQREVIRQIINKLRQVYSFLCDRQPFAVLAFYGLDLPRAIGIPFVGEVADGVLAEVFDHQDLFARFKIEFAIRFKTGGG